MAGVEPGQAPIEIVDLAQRVLAGGTLLMFFVEKLVQLQSREA
jgi:hypothetical protein